MTLIRFFSVRDFDHQDNKFSVFNFVDNSIVANSQSPNSVKTFKWFAVVPMRVRLKLLNLPNYLCS